MDAIKNLAGDALKCVSFAMKPSSTGLAVHNAGFEAAGIAGAYIPFRVDAGQTEGAVSAIKALNIRGAGVSMPHKQDCMPYLDELHPSAEAVGAVNTIVNENGRLIGYNTDVEGVKAALALLKAAPHETVLVVGAGGAARAVLKALDDMGAQSVTVTNRTAEKAMEIARTFGAKSIAWDERNGFKADILINATPMGFKDDAPALPVDEASLANFRKIMDVVPPPTLSPLVKWCRAHNVPVADGATMAFYQAIGQFELYTGQAAPFDAMREAMESKTGCRVQEVPGFKSELAQVA